MNRKKIIPYIFFLSCLFPYTPPILSTDSQPIALFISLILLPICANRINLKQKDFALLLLVLLFSVVTLVFSPWDFNSIRSLSNYISLFTISLVTYALLCKNNGLSFQLFKFAVYAWFIVGAVQTFIYPEFLSFLSPRGTALSNGRGVSCLAPEPTFYAIICSCMLIINYLHFNRGGGVQNLLWVQIILFARSATIIFIIIAVYFIYILLRGRMLRNIVWAGIVGYSLLLCIRLISPYIVSYRAGFLIVSLLDNPALFVCVDESVNERFIHAFFPIYGWLKNYGLPHGFGHFNEFMREVYNQGDFYEYLPYYRDDYTRIMSSIGCAIFELGYVGLIVPYILLRNIVILSKKYSVFIFYGTLFFFILLNAMPLSNAIVGFTFGNIIYSVKRCRLLNNENIVANQRNGQ